MTGEIPGVSGAADYTAGSAYGRAEIEAQRGRCGTDVIHYDALTDRMIAAGILKVKGHEKETGLPQNYVDMMNA